MNSSEPSNTNDPAARIAELESLFSHLQRTVADLNYVILKQGKQLENDDRRILQLEQRFSTLESQVTETREPEDEVPPHY